MSIVIVTGLGPRVGTSFVMNEAKKAGLPIIGHKFLPEWTVPKHNPEGYYDLDPLEFIDLYYSGQLNKRIVKAWGPLLTKVNPNDISCVVLLERKNKQDQLTSIKKVMVDEIKTIKGSQFSNLTAEEILKEHYNSVNLIQSNNILRVYTEDLNKEITNILRFLERGLSWA